MLYVWSFDWALILQFPMLFELEEKSDVLNSHHILIILKETGLIPSVQQVIASPSFVQG